MSDHADRLEKRVHDLEEIVGTLASWLVQAQTGFGKRDAEAIWDLIDKSREAAAPTKEAALPPPRNPGQNEYGGGALAAPTKEDTDE